MQIFEVTLNDGDVVTVNGIHFMKLGDKLMKVTLKLDGCPEIKDGVTSEETVHPDGRKSVKINVPCLGLNAQAMDPNKN